MYHCEVRCFYNKLNPFLLEQNYISSNTPSSMTPFLALLLFGVFSAEFPGNYFPLTFIFPNSEYGFMLSLALKLILVLKCRKILIQLLFTILSIYIFHLAITPCFMHSGISKLAPFLHTKKPPMATNFTHNSIK